MTTREVRSRSQLLAAVLLVFVACTSSPEPELSPGDSRLAYIHGTVVNSGGHPIVGVTVRLASRGYPAVSDVSDLAGAYDLGTIRVRGRCFWSTMRVTAPGYGAYVQKNLLLGPGGNSIGVKLRDTDRTKVWEFTPGACALYPKPMKTQAEKK